MENKAVEFLIPWSVVSVPMEDFYKIFNIDTNFDGTLAIRVLDEHLQNTMSSFSFIHLDKVWGIKRLVAGYVVHDDTMYFTLTCNGEEALKRLDKRFKLVASKENVK